jgi:ATP-dependent DNA helicase RecG
VKSLIEISALLDQLRAMHCESEWFEFKVNNNDPQEIGEYISALSNSAAILGIASAYLIWGVQDQTHEIVGTSFKPRHVKQGNEELENWLLRGLSPRIDFHIYEFEHKGFTCVVFEIQTTTQSPVSFYGVEYIRVGSLKKKLKDYPEKERRLWSLQSSLPFEKDVASKGLNSDDVLKLIDYPTFFDLLKQPLPTNLDGILDRLTKEKVIISQGDCFYDITNLGAILFARDLSKFDSLSRKALRVIQYKDRNRVEALREQMGNKGYAVGFEGAIGYINAILPENEHIEQALRRRVPVYPEIAIRELVANTLIHQDFQIRGTGPLVEIFKDRIEITNPGKPLIDILRFIDEPPQSRNEDLAALMRRMNICEERGSGVDKVISSIEFAQLPPPEFLVTDHHTKAVLYAQKSLNEMDSKDRIRACYQHACLLFVSNKQMTNSTFRDRLGVDQKNYAIVSRIIRETVEAGLVKVVDPGTSNRYMKYIPFWA